MDELLGFVILCTLIGGVYFFIQNDKNKSIEFTKQLHDSVMKKSKSIINQNKTQLARQKKKSIYIDDYEQENLSKWYEKEIPYFMKHHIYPKFNQDELINIHLFSNEIFEEIEKIVNKTVLPKINYDHNMNGFDFEDFCVEILEKKGWKVEKTKSGADQGIDLIIRKQNHSIGVQCKKYSKPIGNKAVQEVKAGISHYNLNHGIVLTNNKFTKSAIELAQTNKIELLHYLDIDKIK